MHRIVQIGWVVWFTGGLLIGGVWNSSATPSDDWSHLKEKYRHFLEVTYWIMTEREREVFLRLTSDRLRDRFIELFWRMRDPTPGTPENEYREEMERRFAYVNRRFRFAGRPGWKTDRGRVYMIYGRPVSTERIDMDLTVYPVEVWYYYGAGKPGLPAHFAIVFYKPHGSGDYRIYSPVADGPYSLLIRRENLDPFDYERLYEIIQEAHPTLAQVVLSPIPGEIPFNYTPTPDVELMLQRILEWPRLEFDDSYAEKFERYAGMIELEEANRFINATFHTYLQWWPDLGYHVWTYAVQPDTVSVAKTEYGTYTMFEVVGRLEDAQSGRLVYQFYKKFRMDFRTDDDLRRLRAGGLLFQDAIPLIPGDYRVRLLLKNPLGREFAFYETTLSVPPVREDNFYADPPIKGYRLESIRPGTLGPFQVGLYRYIDDLKNLYAVHETLYLSGRFYAPDQPDAWEVHVVVQTDEPGRTPVMLGTYRARPQPSTLPNTYEWVLPIPLKTLMAGRFAAIVTLRQGSTVRGTWKVPFSVSPARAVAHPQVLSKTLTRVNAFVWDIAAAEQALARRQWVLAERWLRRALDRKPGFEPTLVRLAELYIRTSRPVEALRLTEGAPPSAIMQVYRLVARQAIDGCGPTVAAMERLYQAGQRHWRLLRTLGLCYWQAGKRDRARSLLQDALILNPDQPDIRSLLEQAQFP